VTRLTVIHDLVGCAQAGPPALRRDGGRGRRRWLELGPQRPEVAPRNRRTSAGKPPHLTLSSGSMRARCLGPIGPGTTPPWRLAFRTTSSGCSSAGTGSLLPRLTTPFRPPPRRVRRHHCHSSEPSAVESARPGRARTRWWAPWSPSSASARIPRQQLQRHHTWYGQGCIPWAAAAVSKACFDAGFNDGRPLGDARHRGPDRARLRLVADLRRAFQAAGRYDASPRRGDIAIVGGDRHACLVESVHLHGHRPDHRGRLPRRTASAMPGRGEHRRLLPPAGVGCPAVARPLPRAGEPG